MKASRFSIYAGLVLAFNLGVIVWGAYVRASGSGAGCGGHWPSCNGQIIPVSPQLQTMIEFTHRVSSGMSIVLIAGLLAWAWRAYPSSHPVRRGAIWSSVFILTEAMLGAGLVLFQLVAGNESAARAVSVALHLANTLLLLAALTATAWWGARGAPIRLHDRGPALWLVTAGCAGLILLSGTGAVTALGDTLFPALSLTAGVLQDVSPTAHFLLRLRIIHPVLAIVVGSFILIASTQVRARLIERGTERLTGVVQVLVGLQFLAGVLNVVLLAPVWLQLSHLFVADLVWVAWVLVSLEVLGVQLNNGAQGASVSIGARARGRPGRASG
jgi:heme A synthase